MSGLTRFGLTDYAKNLFEKMRNGNSLCESVDGAIGEAGARWRSNWNFHGNRTLGWWVLMQMKKREKEVHDWLIRIGLVDVKLALGKGLTNVHAKCGSTDDCRSVLALTLDEDLVWRNSAISGSGHMNVFENSGMSCPHVSTLSSWA